MNKMLNIGCGSRYHPAWVNVNYRSTGEGVIPVDIRRSLPFKSDTFDVVYHSHVLEHLPKDSAVKFLLECHRVARPGSVLRIAVPDLRAIVKQYLMALECAEQGSPEWSDNYEWIVLELFDQMTRNQSGGEMAKYLARKGLPNADYVIARCGIGVKKLIQNKDNESYEMPVRYTTALIKSIVRRLNPGVMSPKRLREILLKLLLKEEYSLLEMGRFRSGGEIHYWMYDSYSLSKLLNQCGFTEVVERSASKSYLENWPSYNLDTEPDGQVYKPDSLYMEAKKL